jgi:A/G-specific adenine glycosylase
MNESIPQDLAVTTKKWLRTRLLHWFAKHRRDLPWRNSKDPYPIWISEVMLQQTQVAAVVPFFQRFLKAFPTIAELAQADEEQVLRLWEGLGYYRRARNLHRAAKIVVQEHAGKIPQDPVQLARLPGFGRYTVGAVLSQAHDLRLPILEANSERVLCRFFGYRDNPKTTAMRKRLWTAAEDILPVKRVGEFNQALMEIGALICKPRKPDCGTCPLQTRCQANRLGLQESIPHRSEPIEFVKQEEVALVVFRKRKVLLVKRPEGGRWEGLWEFPRIELKTGELHEQAAREFLPRLTGIEAHIKGELITIRHGITKYRVTLVCFEAVYSGGKFVPGHYPEGRWVLPGELSQYPISSPQRRIARELTQPNSGSLF